VDKPIHKVVVEKLPTGFVKALWFKEECSRCNNGLARKSKVVEYTRINEKS
jgi:hypothetical protein